MWMFALGVQTILYVSISCPFPAVIIPWPQGLFHLALYDIIFSPEYWVSILKAFLLENILKYRVVYMNGLLAALCNKCIHHFNNCALTSNHLWYPIRWLNTLRFLLGHWVLVKNDNSGKHYREMLKRLLSFFPQQLCSTANYRGLWSKAYGKKWQFSSITPAWIMYEIWQGIWHEDKSCVSEVSLWGGFSKSMWSFLPVKRYSLRKSYFPQYFMKRYQRGFSYHLSLCPQNGNKI